MFCPKCGKQLPDEAEFCSGCGAKLSSKNRLRKSHKRAVITAIAIGAMALLSLLVVFYINLQSSTIWVVTEVTQDYEAIGEATKQHMILSYDDSGNNISRKMSENGSDWYAIYRFEYDENGIPLAGSYEESDGIFNSYRTTNTVDDSGYATSVTFEVVDGFEPRMLYEYDSNHNIVKVIQEKDINGFTKHIVWEYDNRGFCKSIAYNDDTYYFDYEFDLFGNPRRLVLPEWEDEKFSLECDAHGNITKIVYQDDSGNHDYLTLTYKQIEVPSINAKSLSKLDWSIPLAWTSWWI